jgi:hypothetical protein
VKSKNHSPAAGFLNTGCSNFQCNKLPHCHSATALPNLRGLDPKRAPERKQAIRPNRHSAPSHAGARAAAFPLLAAAASHRASLALGSRIFSKDKRKFIAQKFGNRGRRLRALHLAIPAAQHVLPPASAISHSSEDCHLARMPHRLLRQERIIAE